MRNRQWYIKLHKGEFYVAYFVGLGRSIDLERVCSDGEGPIFFDRWIEAYDWTVATKLAGNYALAQVRIR